MRVEDITEDHIRSGEVVTIELDNGSLSSRVVGIMEKRAKDQGFQHVALHRSDCRNWSGVGVTGTYLVRCDGQCLLSNPIKRKDSHRGVYEVKVLHQEPGEEYTQRVVTFATGFTATYRVE